MNSLLRKSLLFAAPFLCVLGFPTIVLWRSGELSSPIAAFAKQQQSQRQALYGLAYSNPDKFYKLRATLRVDPIVLALGSSRVMQIRDDFFARANQFYNAGGAVSRVWNFRQFLARLPRTARVRVLIVSLDQWYFNPRWELPRDASVEAEYESGDTTLNTIQTAWLFVYRDMWRGRLPVGILSHESSNIGVSANVLGDGFRLDGSYRYGSILSDPAHSEDNGFRDSHDRIRTGTRRYEWSDTVFEPAIDEITRFLADCRQRGIHVVAFLPPFAPTVQAEMRHSGHYRYLESIAPRLSSRFDGTGATFVDFTSCVEVGCTDDEFVDGMHGGERVEARMLLEIARLDSGFLPYVDVSHVRDLIVAGGNRLEPVR